VGVGTYLPRPDSARRHHLPECRPRRPRRPGTASAAKVSAAKVSAAEVSAANVGALISGTHEPGTCKRHTLRPLLIAHHLRQLRDGRPT
jgi:hypothetical protein